MGLSVLLIIFCLLAFALFVFFVEEFGNSGPKAVQSRNNVRNELIWLVGNDLHCVVVNDIRKFRFPNVLRLLFKVLSDCDDSLD